MSDWREIIRKDYDNQYSYEVYHDTEYGQVYSDEHRSFEIWATAGTQRYLPVDKVIDPSQAEDVADMLSQAVAHRPLYLLAHSGVSVSTSPFNDPWDSGQCGFAVITNPDEFGLSYGPDSDIAASIDGMVREYDAVLRGQVVGWVVRKKKTCGSCNNTKEEVVDSITGYIMMDYKEIDALIETEIIPTIKSLIKEEQEAEHGPSSVTAGDD